jgi:hypothetical protein
MTLSGACYSYRYHGLVTRPGTLPAAGYLAGLADGLNIVHLACAGFVLLLTPRPRPRRPARPGWGGPPAGDLAEDEGDRGGHDQAEAARGRCRGDTAWVRTGRRAPPRN